MPDYSQVATTAKQVVQQVQSDTIKVHTAVFFFEKQQAAFGLQYIDSVSGDVIRTESWLASGAPLINFVTGASTGTTRLDALEDFTTIVQQVAANEPLKDQLIADGHLKIVEQPLDEIALSLVIA